MVYYAHSTNDKNKHNWHLLKTHLQDTATTAAASAKAFNAERVAFVAGLLHDAGKYSSDFQRRLEGKRIKVDHSTAGAVEVERRYGPLGKLLAYVISGHHCGLPDWGSEIDDSSLSARLKKELLDYSAFFDEIELPPSYNISFPQLKPVIDAGFSVQFFTRFLFSCLVDADYLDTEKELNKQKSAYRSRGYSLKTLAHILDRFIDNMCAAAPATIVNSKRASILANCREKAQFPPGLFTLTVPTGGGKTLSSLSFALRHALKYQKDRVIYVIPYTSIIEQNAAVFRKALGEEYVLEHHSNFTYPHLGLEETKSEFSGDLQQKLVLAAENWDMPIITTTNVQFFESLFAARSSRCRKLHNVANSVVIIDEAQMIPTGYLKPCFSALAELSTNYNTTVVLCTATQPDIEKLLPKTVKPIEIINDPAGLYETFKRVQVHFLDSVNDDELAKRLSVLHQALCIVNSKKHARIIFNKIYHTDTDDEVFHLSTRMCPTHRTAVLKKIKEKLRNRQACRVVSTQLIEAGVDVDFPVVYRSMAGIDSIAQAAGRCNREGRLQSGEVNVFWPEEHGMPRGWLKRTASLGGLVLKRHDDPLGLENVKEYFSSLYEIDDSELDKESILKEISEQERYLNFPFRTLEERFKLIDNSTSTVIIPWDDDCKKMLAKAEYNPFPGQYVRSLQRYGVEVFEKEFSEMLRYGSLQVVANRFYVLREELLNRYYTYDTGLEPFTESMLSYDDYII